MSAAGGDAMSNTPYQSHPRVHSCASTSELDRSDSPPRSSDSPSEFSVGGFTRRSPSSGGLSDLSSLSSQSFTDEAHSDLADSFHSDYELVHATHNPIDGSWTDAMETSQSLADLDRDDTPQASALYHNCSLFASSSLRFPDPQCSSDMSSASDGGASPQLSDHASLPVDQPEVLPEAVTSQPVDTEPLQTSCPPVSQAPNICESDRQLSLESCVAIDKDSTKVNLHPDLEVWTRSRLRTCSHCESLDPPFMEACIVHKAEGKPLACDQPNIQKSLGSRTDTIDAVRKACVATLVFVGVVCLAVYSTKFPSAHSTPCIRSAGPAVAGHPPKPRLLVMNRCNQTLSLRTPRPTNAVVSRPVGAAVMGLATLPMSTIAAPLLEMIETAPESSLADMSTSSSCVSNARQLPEALAEVSQRPLLTAIPATAHVDLALQHALFALSMTFHAVAGEFQDLYKVCMDQSLDLREITRTLVKSCRDQCWDWAQPADEMMKGVANEAKSIGLDRRMLRNMRYRQVRDYAVRVAQGGHNIWNRPRAVAANFCRLALPISKRPTMCDASFYRQNERRSRQESLDDTVESSEYGDRHVRFHASRVQQGLYNIVKRPRAAFANSCRFFLRGGLQPLWCNSQHYI